MSAEKQKYLKAACLLCAMMYEKGCKAVTFTNDDKQAVVDVADVITFLAGMLHKEPVYARSDPNKPQ